MSNDLAGRDIGVRYRKAVAVDGIDIDAPAGRITFLVGPNGAGKSSTMLSIAGSVPCTGRVSVGSEDITHLSATARARAGISFVPEGRQIFPRLTVRQNLEVMAEVLGLRSDAVRAAMDRFPILHDRGNALAGVLSGGEQQMLAVARALMGSARVLLLDELTAGLAPVIVIGLMDDIRRLAEEGVAVLVAEPTIGPLIHYVDHGYVMRRGKVMSEADSGARLEAAYQRAMGLL